MREEQNEELLRRRFQELAERSFRQDRPLFTGFLSPAEAQWALTAGKKAQVFTVLNGGYPDAERVIACFSPEDEVPEFPMDALELRWPHQSAPAHRDILGSVMGLGLERHCIGDIVLEAERAILFCEHSMAEHLRDSLLSAGRIRLQTALLSELPELAPPEGTEWRDTVASPRLDAVVASGCRLSRIQSRRSHQRRSGEIEASAHAAHRRAGGSWRHDLRAGLRPSAGSGDRLPHPKRTLSPQNASLRRQAKSIKPNA